MKSIVLTLAAALLLGACSDSPEWSEDFCKHCKEEFAQPPVYPTITSTEPLQARPR